MAKLTIKNHNGAVAIRHRAVCSDDTWRGKWREDINKAYQDADKHLAKPGQSNHVIEIITEHQVRIRHRRLNN